MIFVYNFLQAVLLLTTTPLLLLIVLGQKKYRERILERLGWGLLEQCRGLDRKGRKIIWIHALSVGEVTSALPLVVGLRKSETDASIVFSAATRTGMRIAEEKIAQHVDRVIAAPLDLLPVVSRFIELIRPDLFILVETDFWPNWLFALKRKAIPLVLVNGRVSSASYTNYHRFRLFFTPLFNTFSLLSMQTASDAAQMERLGVARERIKPLGNLKYDTRLPGTDGTGRAPSWVDARIPVNAVVWVCGSTHAGEEEILLSVFASLRQKIPELLLLLAPRHPGRAGEIEKLAAGKGLRCMRRSRPADPAAPILILDTLGELAGCYRLARLAFVGGSLVDQGGHNPLEPAAYGVPILFGPHMEDFLEIARDLVDCGAARTVDATAELERAVSLILEREEVCKKMGTAARTLVEQHAGVVRHHVRELAALLADSPGSH